MTTPPDGTGRIVDDYISSLKKMAEGTIDVIHRTAKNGLSSAILNGIQRARGETIVVMDSDFSTPAADNTKAHRGSKTVRACSRIKVYCRRRGSGTGLQKDG